ncbi:MAG: dihydroorotase [Thermoleophilia bacterium]|nr:dihydroorotase [Thermoleophilia bacterium]
MTNVVPGNSRVRLPQRSGDLARVVIVGARVLDPAAGIDEVRDLVICDGVIGGDPTGLPVFYGAGLTVIPGIVDVHVHLRTPGREDVEDIASGTRAAAAGGVVTVLAMPNTQPALDSVSILGSLMERAEREAVVPTGFIPAITMGQHGESLTDHGDLAEAGAAALSDDGVPVGNALLMRRALQYQKAAGLLFTLHEEDLALSDTGVMHEGVVSARIGLAGIPGISEAVQVARDCVLAGYEDGRIHICHVSARETVDEIRRAKARGVAVTAEVTPHHLLLTEDAIGDDPDPARFKMNPPLRAEEDRRALIEGLRDGTIDCVATDHAPHLADEKEVPFAEAPFGVIGLETAFAACHTELVRGGVMSLDDLVLRMSTNPARIFGLPVPTLVEGAVANLAVVDTAATDRVGDRPYESKSGNAAFVGRELTGRVVMTLAGGQDVYRRNA